jgi:hypothetical protein
MGYGIPITLTGPVVDVYVVSPSWPLAFWPQHFAAPVLRTAQVCSKLAEIALKPELNAAGYTGLFLCVFVPSPI